MGSDWYTGEYEECRDQATTVATIQCLEHFTMDWQQQLDTALEELTQQDHRDDLQAVQRLWSEYRRASCATRAGQGSITEIQAAECWRVLTMHRAQELMAQLKF